MSSPTSTGHGGWDASGELEHACCRGAVVVVEWGHSRVRYQGHSLSFADRVSSEPRPLDHCTVAVPNTDASVGVVDMKLDMRQDKQTWYQVQRKEA